MNNNEKTKKAFLFLMMLTVTLASSGCGMLEINQKRASQIVVTNLEEKYGGDFEVRTVERKNLGVNAFKDHVYVMNVYSEELDELFQQDYDRFTQITAGESEYEDIDEQIGDDEETENMRKEDILD